MSSLGDILHTFPMATDIRRAIASSQIEWVVEEAYVPLVRLHPAVSRVIPIALRRWRKQLLQPGAWREFSRFREELSQHSYDAILDTQGLAKSVSVARMARGPV